MASQGLFGHTGRSSSKNLVEFRAGKMTLKGTTVTPDKRKGLVYIYQSEDSLMHFCWKDRGTGTVEDVREMELSPLFFSVNWFKVSVSFLNTQKKQRTSLYHGWKGSPAKIFGENFLHTKHKPYILWPQFSPLCTALFDLLGISNSYHYVQLQGNLIEHKQCDWVWLNSELSKRW